MTYIFTAIYLRHNFLTFIFFLTFQLGLPCVLLLKVIATYTFKLNNKCTREDFILFINHYIVFSFSTEILIFIFISRCVYNYK